MSIPLMKIDELLSNATILGTGFIPINENSWWFAIGNEKYWKRSSQGLQISFTAIGGHVEEGESFVEATIREIQEETGTEANLVASDQTYYVTAVQEENEKFDFQIQSISPIKVKDNPAPYIIYSVKIKSDVLGVIVYKGEFASDPYPQMEVPALFRLSPQLLQQTPAILSELVKAGGKIREQKDKIPREAIMYPFGSATIIQAILKTANSVF